MSTPSDKTIVPPSELTPDTIELGEIELDAITSMFADLSINMKRQAEYQQTIQQLNNAFQQNQSEMMGNGKAIETFIKTIVKTKGFLGKYAFDTEKKILVKQG